jgi:hypothetical protein
MRRSPIRIAGKSHSVRPLGVPPMLSSSMRPLLIALVLPMQAAASSRELVHPFPPAGPTEVAGATRANRVLRAVQTYSAPSFTDTLAAHVAHTLRGASDERVTVRRALVRRRRSA